VTHVARDVPGRLHDRPDASDPAPVVEKRADDRYPGTAGDVVEPRPPVHRAAAGPRRWDHEMKPIDGFEAGNGLLDQVLVYGAVDRNAAEPAHHPAERPAEEFALAEPGRVDVENPG